MGPAARTKLSDCIGISTLLGVNMLLDAKNRRAADAADHS